MEGVYSKVNIITFDFFAGFPALKPQFITQTSFIIMSNKGRLPASGLGAKRPE
jgi:hypothetical protein